VAAVDDIDEIVVWVRTHGPAPLPLDGWDRASTWGWDDATGSLYAHLWRNTDEPAKSSAIWIGPDDYTSAITLPETLAQHIALAVDCSPWSVITALDEIVDQDEDRSEKGDDASADQRATVVTITEGHVIRWPPSFGSRRKRTA
jgi:hypothetical protein